MTGMYARNQVAAQWFNSTLLDYMDLYVDPTTRCYLLMEKYNCDILTTSRIYIDHSTGKRILLPPSAWKSSVINWKENRPAYSYSMNGCTMYEFETFEDFITYIRVVHATRETIPFLRITNYLEEESLARLVDADSDPPQRKTVKPCKVYIS